MSHDTVDIWKMLEYFVITGASKIGNDLVDEGVKLHSLYGATEVGDIICFFRNEVEQI